MEELQQVSLTCSLKHFRWFQGGSGIMSVIGSEPFLLAVVMSTITLEVKWESTCIVIFADDIVKCLILLGDEKNERH